MAHAIDRHLVGLDTHELRIVHVLVGQLEHAVGQCGRKQQVQTLVPLGQASQDIPDVADEAQVEHAVGLVEHENLDAPKAEDALLGKVDDAARCADQDVDALGELAALFLVIGTAEREPELVGEMCAEPGRVLVDLHGELTGRGENQGPRTRLFRLQRGMRFEVLE